MNDEDPPATYRRVASADEPMPLAPKLVDDRRAAGLRVSAPRGE